MRRVVAPATSAPMASAASARDSISRPAARDLSSEACAVSVARTCWWGSEEHTSELQSHSDLVCRLLLEKKKNTSELQSHSDLVCRLLLEKKKQLLESQEIYTIRRGDTILSV